MGVDEIMMQYININLSNINNMTYLDNSVTFSLVAGITMVVRVEVHDLGEITGLSKYILDNARDIYIKKDPVRLRDYVDA